jgi:hypothetical protein
MAQRLSRPVVGALASVVMSGLAALAEPPPAADELTENSAARWGAAAQNGWAAVYDDRARFRIGSAALRFETDGGFDTWLWAPKAKDASWDLLSGGAGGPGVWVYAENENFSFQNASPWVRLYSSPGNYVEFQTSREMLNEALGRSVQLRIPLNGDDLWQRRVSGQPDLRSVRWIEIHADTWGAGFKLWLDGMSFDVPLSPPGRLRAIAGNARVALSWREFVDVTGSFDHYAIYRDTRPFSSVKGMTPIATLPDVHATTYTDETAANGTGYYYAVTAVLREGGETSEVSPVGPRTPRDETDLHMLSLARTPRYPRYDPIYTYYEITEDSGFGPYIFSAATGLGSGQNENTQRWPHIGQPVTYVATVRNRGTNAWAGVLMGTWQVDGQTVSQPQVQASLAPGETAVLELVQAWDVESHEIRFSFELADARPENNGLAIDSRSVAFLSYVDRSYLENFREKTRDYPEAATDDIIDWLHRHMARFNELFVAGGTGKRVHYDLLEVTEDDAPDPQIERILFAIFPFRFYADDGDIRLSGYYSRADDIDYGLLHEMGHQLGLIDLYRLNLGPDQNEVSGRPYSGPACLMNGVSPFLSEHSARAMEHWLKTAHGYYGQYMYSIPARVRLRFAGIDGQPLSGASVRVYQMCERPGRGQVITQQVKTAGQTDSDGVFELPNVRIDARLVPPAYNGDELHDNPFGYVAVVGTNAVLHFAVEDRGFIDYAWLDITETNNAYWAGQTGEATFERRLLLGGRIQKYPPADMSELNAASWASWAEDGTITLRDDTARRRVGQASVRIDATGGFDNYVRYPGDRLAQWDLTGVEHIGAWFYAINDNGGFQNGSPWVRIGNAEGYFEWRPTYDILNEAIGRWVRFEIPIGGDGLWRRTQHGSPSLAEVHYLELHADTWGAGFKLWMDGVGFVPTPPIPGDVNGDGRVDLADLAELLAAFGKCAGEEGYNADADIDGSGCVGLEDLATLLSNFGQP